MSAVSPKIVESNQVRTHGARQHLRRRALVRPSRRRAEPLHGNFTDPIHKEEDQHADL